MISFKWLLVIRILEALFLRTSFNPDEHWQANEVAYHLIFKDPKALLTWEWLPPAEIRGWAHPFVFAALYKILAISGLDSRWMIAWGPRILQSVFAASCDLAVGILGGSKAQHLQLLNWFMAFCLTRTYSNSLECVLFTWSLVAYLRWRSSFHAFLIAGLTLLMRPTAAVLYVPLGIHHLFFRKGRLSELIPGAFVYLVLTLVIDWFGYAHLVFVPWNFVKINALEGISAQYGTHPPLWYVYAAVPFMLGPHLPAFVQALTSRKLLSKHSLLLAICALTIGIYSINPHKEFRFILPLMPCLFLIAADAPGRSVFTSTRFLLITNTVLFGFFGLIHQAGPDAVLSELARVRPQTVLFLMGCHQTAFAAHLHGLGIADLRQLDCSPTKPKPNESERFFADPSGFTKKEIFSTSLPSHVVVYDDKRLNDLEAVLISSGFHLHSRHSHIPLDWLGEEKAMLIYEHQDFYQSK
jgi:phosphatidylinositol glycan class B